ncbi:MAG: sensor histidine kinase [Synergistaceae bacterium]|nr:sensor histidine kinase [Synergistaceae bacterium]
MFASLRKKFTSSKSHLLAWLLSALVIPSAAVVLVAIAGMVSQERAMDEAVSSYVQDLAESMSYHLASDSEVWAYSMLSEFTRLPFFSWGPSIPGWVALIGQDGRVVAASPGAMNISAIWNNTLPVGHAVKVEDKDGAQYTLAVQPVKRPSGGYVVAAVSWTQLLGGLVGVTRIWPALVVIIALSIFVAIRMLWRFLVIPLQSIVAEIDNMTLGKDVPEDLPDMAVQEIESVHFALVRSAQAAVDRNILRNNYVRDIVKAQEQERLDMAREIHDGPLQDITALLQQLHMAREEENNIERVKRTEVIAKTVVRELRSLCDELAPPWVDLGLVEALTELADRLAQVYYIGVFTDFDEDAKIEVDSEKTLSLLRIVQEAVSNAVRHGEASEVLIKLHKDDDDTLTLEISDNGRGFEAKNINHETLRVEGHRGLASMTERMSLMGGTVKITSTPGEGTIITAQFKA